MTDACDFSESHPTPAQVKAAGLVAVIAKINGPSAITPGEVAAFVAAGIVVGFYFEVLATDVQGGWTAGAKNTEAAVPILANLIGQEAANAQPLYLAADQNIQMANNALLETATAYFVGASVVRPSAYNGVYGNGSFLNWLGGVGLANWFWQSASASYEGNASVIPAAHIHQLVGAPIPGTDSDQLLKGDCGQYPRPT